MNRAPVIPCPPADFNYSATESAVSTASAVSEPVSSSLSPQPIKNPSAAIARKYFILHLQDVNIHTSNLLYTLKRAYLDYFSSGGAEQSSDSSDDSCVVSFSAGSLSTTFISRTAIKRNVKTKAIFNP